MTFIKMAFFKMTFKTMKNLQNNITERQFAEWHYRKAFCRMTLQKSILQKDNKERHCVMRLSTITFQKNIMSLFKMTLCIMAEWHFAPLQNVKMSFCKMSEWHFTNDALQDDRMTLCRQTQSKLQRCACYNSTWQILNTFFVLLCRVSLFWMSWHQTTAPFLLSYVVAQIT